MNVPEPFVEQGSRGPERERRLSGCRSCRGDCFTRRTALRTWLACWSWCRALADGERDGLRGTRRASPRGDRVGEHPRRRGGCRRWRGSGGHARTWRLSWSLSVNEPGCGEPGVAGSVGLRADRSEEHTSELQSRREL